MSNTKQTNKSKKNLKKEKKTSVVLSKILLLLIIFLLLLCYEKKRNYNFELMDQTENQMILKNYNKYVITNKKTTIYKYKNNKMKIIGTISKNQELILDKKMKIYNDFYFKITNLDEEYYIYYRDVKPIKKLTVNDERYKNYILFNKNIITKNITSFYDKKNNYIYTINKSFDLPIIIKKDNMYGVEYNNKLLYVKKEDVKVIKKNNNTKLKNTAGIAVLNYHFFYDDSQKEEIKDCNQIICLSTSKLINHLEYIKTNNIFTPTMEELEMYIDGYLQLPKSVVLTIDDGWRADIGTKIMNEYKINATLFLMGAYYEPEWFEDEFIEVHSHGYDIHNPGICSGGQGGAIKCLEKNKLVEDLKKSRDKLGNTTVFCYPFYEYNDYSIEVLKEAGFTMAFGGEAEDGYSKVKPGIDKYRLPRYVIYNKTTDKNIASYIG